MTYNRKGIAGCSARRVAIRDTKVDKPSFTPTIAYFERAFSLTDFSLRLFGRFV